MNYKHGMGGTPEYWAWRDRLRRCYDKNCLNYKRYGGRGITVCRSWRKSVMQFYKNL